MRYEQFLRGKSLVDFICALAVAMASILHMDASFPSAPVDCAVVSASQDDDQGADQVSERCHFCSVTAFASFAMPAIVESSSPAVPCGRSRQLIPFELPATAPPPKS